MPPHTGQRDPGPRRAITAAQTALAFASPRAEAVTQMPLSAEADRRDSLDVAQPQSGDPLARVQECRGLHADDRRSRVSPHEHVAVTPVTSTPLVSLRVEVRSSLGRRRLWSMSGARSHSSAPSSRRRH